MQLITQFNARGPGWTARLLSNKERLLQLGLVFLFLSAFALRLYKLDAPGMLPEREFRSMFIARATYYEHADSVADWQKEITQISLQKLGVLEPPLLETLVTGLYLVAGRESVWIARVVTAIFWLVGGILLFKIARKMMTPGAAFLTTAYYLFFPLGVLTSRSFQPDSLMIMMFLASLSALLWYDARPSLFRVVGAAGITALMLLMKPLPIFTVFGASVGLAIKRKGWRHFVDSEFLTFNCVALIPVIFYYAYGLFGAGFLQGQAEMSFRPGLLRHWEFWQGWMVVGVGAVGYTALLGGLLGWLLLRDRSQRAFLTGLWIGYIIFGLVFTHHIHTHTYYHLQLAVIVALSLGPPLDYLLAQLAALPANWYWPLPIGAILVVTTFFNLQAIRAGLNAPNFESPEIAQEIGELVNHSSRLVLVSRHYGQSLEYYGQLSGTPWPKAIEYWLYRRPGERELSIQERLANLGFTPEYFIVTDFSGLDNRHADLKQYLNSYCTVFAENDQYLIYDGDCVH